MATMQSLERARSSVGRACGLHPQGRGFEPCRAHQPVRLPSAPAMYRARTADLPSVTTPHTPAEILRPVQQIRWHDWKPGRLLPKFSRAINPS